MGEISDHEESDDDWEASVDSWVDVEEELDSQ